MQKYQCARSWQQELVEVANRSAGVVLMAPPDDSPEARASIATLLSALKPKQKARKAPAAPARVMLAPSRRLQLYGVVAAYALFDRLCIYPISAPCMLLQRFLGQGGSAGPVCCGQHG